MGLRRLAGHLTGTWPRALFQVILIAPILPVPRSFLPWLQRLLLGNFCISQMTSFALVTSRCNVAALYPGDQKT